MVDEDDGEEGVRLGNGIVGFVVVQGEVVVVDKMMRVLLGKGKAYDGSGDESGDERSRWVFFYVWMRNDDDVLNDGWVLEEEGIGLG